MNPEPQPESLTLEAMRKLALAAEGQAAQACPDCGCRDFRVSNRWITKAGKIRRLKKCRHCGRPVHTSETTED